MIKEEKGLTLFEVIIAVAIMGIVLPLIMHYIIAAFKDSNKVGDKLFIQTTVNILMNSLEKHIMEADIPVTNSTIEEDATQDKEVEIEKPGESSVKFIFVSGDKQITYQELTEDVVTYEKVYDNIIEFEAVKPKDSEDNELENGMQVGIKAELNGNEYSLRNTYYTRNTVPSI